MRRVNCTKGQRFGRLVVIGEPFAVDVGIRNVTNIEVICDCGITKCVVASRMIGGAVRSCGCLRREESSARLSTHGMSKTPLYKKWNHLFDRCKGFKPRDRKNYTDRGISVCERWIVFENFLADMGHPPHGRSTIDRIDNSKGYSPDNCRWASMREQCNNKTTNVIVEYAGEADTVANWARRLGVCSKALRYRLRNGWTVDQAFNTPYNHSNKLDKLT